MAISRLGGVAAHFLKPIAALGVAVKTSARELVTASPLITAASGAASASDPNGSLYLRTDGAPEFRSGGAWYALPVSGIGETGVRTVSGTIATGAVLALNATPAELVAAPGAGLFIELVSCHLWLDYATTAYNGIAAGEDLIISYTDGSGEEVARIETTGFLDQAADEHRIVRAGSAYDSVAAHEPVANAALVLSLLSGEIATGDSPLKFEVQYRVRTLAFS